MKLFRLLLTALFLCFAAPSLAQVDLAMSEEQAQQVQLALNRGLDLYRHDQAAWHATDAMLEDIRDLEASGIRGWVVTEADAGSLLVTFWKPDGDSFAGVYSARYDGEQVKDRRELEGTSARLTDSQVALIRARQLTIGLELQRCANTSFNTVVLPPETEGAPILVYLLTPQTSGETVPLGGHFRFTVQDGEFVDRRPFMNSCFDMPLRNASTEAFVVSHLLDPVPTEIHVFSTFASRTPIFVLTTENGYIWVTEIIEGQPQIRLLQIGAEDE